MAKQTRSEEQLHGALLSHGDSLFRLFYMHTKKPGEAESLMEAVLLQYAVSTAALQTPEEERRWLLSAAHGVAMDYYAKKLRKNPADEQLRRLGRNLPFSVTKELCAVLRLPYTVLTPLALLSEGMEEAEAASVARCPLWLLRRRLSRAEKAAGMTLAEILSWVETIELPAEIRGRALYGTTNAMHDKHFNTNSGVRTFKQRMDRAIPFVALGVISVCVFSVLAVRLGWFGSVFSSTPSAIPGDVYGSAVTSAPESHATAAPTEAPADPGDVLYTRVTVFVPDAAGLVQYDFASMEADAVKIVEKMAEKGAFPAEVSLSSLEYRRDGKVVQSVKSGEQLTVRLYFSGALQDYLDSAPSTASLEAVAKTFRAFYESAGMTLAVLEVYADGTPVAVSGHEINCTALMYGELPITSVIEEE